MSHLSGGRSALVVLSLSVVCPAFAEEASPPATRQGVEEIVVTAQKREENINDVAMSIQAATGDELNQLGITDTAQLDRVVTGFNSNVTYYGTAIYTIRGVGFQDTALASGPTVSVYIDEVPLPFSAMTQGAVLDLQRVEALKGPQGTLFGQNATGGAVNYIANKPTEEFESGVDASYGRFNTKDVQGFVSGPITDTLRYRVAGRFLLADAWQETYVDASDLPADPYWTQQGRNYDFDNQWGDQEFYNARVQLLWEPTDQLSALFTLSGFMDKGDSPMPQLVGITPLNPINVVNPLVADYPEAPRDAQAASWGPCVNASGGTPADVSLTQNLANRLYDDCEDAEKDNNFYSPALRVDYHLTEDLTITSLTSYEEFERDQQLESDGTIYQDYESNQDGNIQAFNQELRIAGSVMGEGAWVFGLNYQHTRSWDSFLQTYGISTAVPTQVITATQLGPTRPNNLQRTTTYAAFGNVEYPMWETITLQAGVRYTNEQRDYRGCGSDGGDGSWADISAEIQTVLQVVNGDPVIGGLDVGPGNCGSTGEGPTYFPSAGGFTDKLNQDNISWRTGVNWTPMDEMLLYANVSQGYKSGSFPTVASAAFVQLFPAKQEDLLAYELGGKFGLFDGRLQLNAATFYYDYTDKQILGAINDFVFGSLPALVNVPDSHVIGFEVAAAWEPLDGLVISPSISYADSEIDGEFRNFDPFFHPVLNNSTKDFVGEPFPNAPKWQSNVSVQYEWTLRGDMTAFVGGNYNYQSATKGFFYDRCAEPAGAIDPVSGNVVTCTKDFLGANPDFYGDTDLAIPSRGLLDLWAGVQTGPWRIWAWGRNVTDDYYWNQVQHVNDVLLRWAGLPVTYGLSVSHRSGG